jgi:hypothetical protein
MTHSDTFPLRGQSDSWALPRAIAANGGDTDKRRNRRVPAPPFRPSVKISRARPCGASAFGLRRGTMDEKKVAKMLTLKYEKELII